MMNTYKREIHFLFFFFSLHEVQRVLLEILRVLGSLEVLQNFAHLGAQ